MLKTEERLIKQTTIVEDITQQIVLYKGERKSLEISFLCNLHFIIIREIAQNTNSNIAATVLTTFF